MKTQTKSDNNEKIRIRIEQALIYKGMKKTELAKLLAEDEIKEWKYKPSEEDVTKTIEKYKNYITRWVKGNRNPSLNSIKTISKVLNISIDFFLGKLHFPLQEYLSEDQQQEIELFQKRGFLFKYIEEYLMYDIDKVLVYDKDGKPVEPLFFQIEREVNAFLSARLDNLGVSKKEGKDNGNNTQEE